MVDTLRQDGIVIMVLKKSYVNGGYLYKPDDAPNRVETRSNFIEDKFYCFFIQ